MHTIGPIITDNAKQSQDLIYKSSSKLYMEKTITYAELSFIKQKFKAKTQDKEGISPNQQR